MAADVILHNARIATNRASSFVEAVSCKGVNRFLDIQEALGDQRLERH